MTGRGGRGSGSLQRSILVYTTGSFLVIGAAVALASTLPLYGRLRENQKRSLQHTLVIRALSVSELCRNMGQVSIQVTSRSKARLQLEAYNRREVSLRDAARFIRPLLQDALDRADGVRGITRVAPGGELVVSVGLVTPKRFRIPPDGTGARISGPVVVAGSRNLVVGAPMLSRSGARVGTDYLLFDLALLERLVPSGLGETGQCVIGTLQGDSVEFLLTPHTEDPLSTALQRALKAGALGGSGILSDAPDDQVIAYAPIGGSPSWGMAIAQSSSELYAPLDYPVLLSGSLLLGLLLLGTLGMVGLLRPLTRRAIHADELEDVVADRTRALAEEYSQRIKIEEAQRELEGQVQERQRLEGLGLLAGGIAHDFNNLLMGVLGNADLARLHAPDDSALLQHLEQICAAAERAADLCHQLLAYAGKSRLVVERLDLRGLLEEMVKLVEVLLSKSATLELKFEDDVWPIEGDATQLRQVAMNLITNASEALGDQAGVITVSTGSADWDPDDTEPGWLSGADMAAGRYSFFEVADTGCGMDEDTHDRIFDPFFTTKFTGRGLGMAAVLGIVRSHNGALRVHSRPGAGTTIRVLLPCVEPDPQSAEAFEPTDSWRGSGLVLIVDDDQDVLAATTGLVEFLGFDVVVASNGQEALDRFREHRAEVRCVLLDLTMPKVGGDEVLRELRRLEPEVRVVLMSGHALPTSSGALPAAGFLQKPFTLNTLSQALQQNLQT